ncbi:lipase [Acrasis kona]|uniref:Lipase n=1 Tax=Acrasis kona TaxID=1008807 RepID=A0AAW2ZF73_9EUKA
MKRVPRIRSNPCLSGKLFVRTPRKQSFSTTVAKASMDAEEIKPPGKTIETHGLHLYLSRKVEGEDVERERSGEQSNKTIDSVYRFIEALNKADVPEKLSDEVKVIKDIAHKLVDDLVRIDEYIRSKYENLDTHSSPIQSFQFEFRGMYITIRYTLDTLTEKLHSELTSSRCTRIVKKITVLKTIAQMGVIVTEERDAIVQQALSDGIKLDNDKTFYPFSDTLNINDYEELKLDASQYFQDIGTQFAPMMRMFLSLMVTATAAHGTSLEYQPLFRKGVFYASNVFYFLNQQAAASRAAHYMSNANTESQKLLWTMPDTNKMLRRASFMTYPDIEMSATFEIPFIRSQESDLTTGQPEHFDNVEQELQHYTDQLTNRLPINLHNMIPVRIISAHPMKHHPKDKESTRLIRDYPYLTKFLHGFHKLKNIFSHKGNKTSSPGFIFHVHGGGFMALSSFSHESYLRQWATMTNLPILSVDYSKTPEQHFPVQLEECYQAYKWLIEHGRDALGLDMNKIIFAGDSAGGNIVSALLVRLIQEGLRLPDGLVLSYPATYLHFSPSPARLMSTLDPILNTHVLELCGLEYYMTSTDAQQNNAQRNPYISPAVTPDHILKKFPPTLIAAGALDPLFDDAWYMAKRIEQVNGEKGVTLQVFDSLGHGYLNLVSAVPEAKLASQRICDWINGRLFIKTNS